MTKPDPKALRGLLEKATAGLWYSTKPNKFGEAEIMSPVGDSRNEDEDWIIASTAGFDCDDEGSANAELIPAMHNALPDLIDAYEERDRLKAALSDAAETLWDLNPEQRPFAIEAALEIIFEALEPKQ